jgi:hypothetical protein
MSNIKYNKVATVQILNTVIRNERLGIKLPVTGQLHLVCGCYYQPVTWLCKESQFVKCLARSDVLN